MDDEGLIAEAEKLASEERLFGAARLLRMVKDTEILSEKHHEILGWEQTIQASMKILLESPDKEGSTWTKQSENQGERNFLVYYQVDAATNQLFCRIESAIEGSLLVPILSVFNESDLYETWMPYWKRPVTLGCRETKMLKEASRGNQIIQVTVDMPFGFSTRETVFHTIAVDAIEEEGAIAIEVVSASPQDDPIIPEPLPGVIRIQFSLSMLIRECPSDHPCYQRTKDSYPNDEGIFLLSTKMTINAHVAGLPIRFINFVTRTVIGAIWGKLLQVAERIRDGTMVSHQEAIAQKRDLYDWIESRLAVMIGNVNKES